MDGEAAHTCTGSQCSLMLSSTCAATALSLSAAADPEATAGEGEAVCNYTITATAAGAGRAVSLPAVFTYTLTLPSVARAPIFSPPPDGVAFKVDFQQALPVTLACPDAGTKPYYVLTPDDAQLQPEVSQFSTPYKGPMLLRTEIEGVEAGHEGSSRMEGVTLVHAVCYSSTLRISRTETARYAVQERAPSPVISPRSKSFEWAGGDSISLGIRDALPSAVMSYAVNAGGWSVCTDGNDIAEGSGVRCSVKLPFSCTDVAHAAVDSEGYSNCLVTLAARAGGKDMGESYTTEEQYTLRVPPALSPPVLSPDPSYEQVIDADGALSVDISCPPGSQVVSPSYTDVC